LRIDSEASSHLSATTSSTPNEGTSRCRSMRSSKGPEIRDRYRASASGRQVQRPSVSSNIPQKHLRVALLFQTPVTLKASKRAEVPLKLVHIGNHIRLARYIRRLTLDEAGKLIGTKSRNLLLWEQGSTEPQIGAIPGILRFLGYDPFPPPRTTLRERLYSTRRVIGLDSKQIARLYGVDQKTWWWWETEKHSPLPSRVKDLERFLEFSYAEAMKDWPGKPPEGSRTCPTTYRLIDGKPVTVKTRVGSSLHAGPNIR
jgi:transcriptional regulator with XRE-family HTH domain